MTPKLLYDRIGMAWVLVAVCAAGCASSGRETSAPWGRRLRTADGKSGRQGVVDAAIANAKEAEPPKILPETHFAAGRLFETQGQFDKAVHQYRKAVAVNHHYVEAYHRLGLTLSRTGKHDEAAQALRRAVELKPDSAQLRNDLGFELLLCRQWAEAEEQLVHAVNLKPDFARAYVNLGIVQSKRGRFSEALATFRSVLPEADAYYNLGLMYRGQRRFDEAVAAFRRVLSLDPKFTAAHKQLDQIVAQYEPPSPLDTELRIAGESIHQDAARPVGRSLVEAPATEEHSAEARTDEATWSRAFETLDEMMYADRPRADSSRRTGAEESHAAASQDNHGVSPSKVTTDSPGERKTNFGAPDRVSESESSAPESGRRADRRPVQTTRAEKGGPEDRLTEFPATDGPTCQADDPLSCPATEWTEYVSMLAVCHADHETLRDDFALAVQGFPGTSRPSTEEPPYLAVSCIDQWAMLRELGEELSIVRNQIDCLESNLDGDSMPFASLRAPQLRISENDSPQTQMETDLLMGPPAPGEVDDSFDPWATFGWPVPFDAQLASDVLPPQQRSTNAARDPENSQEPKNR